VSHGLGIDLRTTFGAAAVARDRRAEMVPLGDTSAVAHASVLSRQDFQDLIRVPVEWMLSPPGELASVGSV
jgi:hypothetical protein